MKKEKMLIKCKSKKFRNNGVLVKFPKKKQDLRIDLPSGIYHLFNNGETTTVTLLK